jgi:hypothetical protein
LLQLGTQSGIYRSVIVAVRNTVRDLQVSHNYGQEHGQGFTRQLWSQSGIYSSVIIMVTVRNTVRDLQVSYNYGHSQEHDQGFTHQLWLQSGIYRSVKDRATSAGLIGTHSRIYRLLKLPGPRTNMK